MPPGNTPNFASLINRHPLDKLFWRLSHSDHPLLTEHPGYRYQSRGFYYDMINTTAINDWLQRNALPPVIHHFLLVTSNSELLSYSTPQNIKKFRSEAALVVKTWKEHDQELMQQHGRTQSSFDNHDNKPSEGELKALTIEMTSGNILVRAVQPCLLLVLVGCNDQPNELGDFINRFHAEAAGDARYPSAPPVISIEFSKSSLSSSSKGSDSGNDSKTNEQDTQSSPAGSDNVEDENGSDGQESKEGTKSDVAQTLVGSPGSAERSILQNTSAESSTVGGGQNQSLAILHLQRTKLDNMVKWFQAQLEHHQFIFREGGP